MDNPIISALVPYVTSRSRQRVSIDTYGPSYLPNGIVVLVTADDGSESEIGRGAITAVSKTQFVGWFSDAATWLNRHLKLNGL